ncbi:MAG: hypothetical protein LBS49_14945 [Candidatus Accumulibacter sp.]|jgi:hypothetical protein|nr:hypothetical protein [Accumulibacter sp.]
MGALSLLAVLLVAGGRSAADPGPREAIFAISNLIYYLVALVVSVLVSWATRPKPEKPEAQTATAPQVKDGAAVVRVYGDVWIDDSIVLAWRQAGTQAIKTKGGKK